MIVIHKQEHGILMYIVYWVNHMLVMVESIHPYCIQYQWSFWIISYCDSRTRTEIFLGWFPNADHHEILARSPTWGPNNSPRNLHGLMQWPLSWVHSAPFWTRIHVRSGTVWRHLIKQESKLEFSGKVNYFLLYVGNKCQITYLCNDFLCVFPYSFSKLRTGEEG